MKADIVKLVLKTVEENPSNLYEALEEKGYSRLRAYGYLPRLTKLGYLTRLEKGRYVLTMLGKKRLNRVLYGVGPCPFCGSYKTKRNGRRNGKGAQRFACCQCGFNWTEGYKLEAIIRALKKKKRVFFILHTSERFGLPILEKLREWLKSDELGYLSKNLNLVIP